MFIFMRIVLSMCRLGWMEGDGGQTAFTPRRSVRGVWLVELVFLSQQDGEELFAVPGETAPSIDFA